MLPSFCSCSVMCTPQASATCTRRRPVRAVRRCLMNPEAAPRHSIIPAPGKKSRVAALGSDASGRFITAFNERARLAGDRVLLITEMGPPSTASPPPLDVPCGGFLSSLFVSYLARCGKLDYVPTADLAVYIPYETTSSCLLIVASW